MSSAWWLAVLVGGPVRPTGAALLERPNNNNASATLHSALRLDHSGRSEDDQAGDLARQVAELAEREPLVVVLARAAGVGRDLETLWREAMPPQSAVRISPLPRGTEESGRAREDLVTALHLARSRRQLYTNADINAALDTYMSQQPAPYGETLDPHDSDPHGIAVPCALAVHHSDPSRQIGIHSPASVTRSDVHAHEVDRVRRVGGYPSTEIAAEVARRHGGNPYEQHRINRPRPYPYRSPW